MKRTKLITAMSRNAHRLAFKAKKHSPELLVVAGVVTFGATIVSACVATTKIDEIKENAKKKINEIHTDMDAGEVEGVEYTKEDGKRDLTITYAKTGLQFAKLYAPTAALATFSMGCLLTSNHILRNRSIAFAAAYATVDQGFKEYRGRVIERFGKELDRELKHDIKTREVEEVIVNEDGSEQVVTKTIETANINEHSDFARFYDESCLGWEKDPEHNLMFLKHQQNYANELLQAQTYLFLNDVYEMLGIQKTKAGQVVGWVYDEEHPIGDNYVDFGIYDLHNERKRAFVNGHERNILLDFNVDGNILQYI